MTSRLGKGKPRNLFLRCMNFEPAGRLLKILRVLKYPFVTNGLTWVAKLVARPLYKAALQIRIQTSLEHHKFAQVGLCVE